MTRSPFYDQVMEGYLNYGVEGLLEHDIQYYNLISLSLLY